MILNLTQHPATPEQVAAGVVDPTPEMRERIVSYLTFSDLPEPGDINNAAAGLCDLVDGWCVDLGISFEGDRSTWPEVMIGGAPFLMPALESWLMSELRLQPVYAFSRREVEEVTTEDGAVRKVAVFRHLGFVRPMLYP